MFISEPKIRTPHYEIENMFLYYNSGYDIIFIGAVPRFLRGGDVYGKGAINNK